MKVTKQVDVVVDVEVDISLDDVMAEIAALDAPTSNAEVQRLLNLCLSAVKKVPDHLVAGMNDAQRQIVVDVLSTELDRYRELVAVAN